MSWRLIDKPRTVRVTKQLAETYSTMDPAPHDRPLSERRLQVYRSILKEGGFRPVSWASALCKETGGVYRVNGKHTSTMLAGMPVIPEFYAIIEEYECDTLDDVARLYATFDSNIQSRTARDIYLSFAATMPELARLPGGHINLVVVGMDGHTTSYSAKGGTMRTQAASKAEALLEYPEFVIWMSCLLSNNTGRTDGSGSKERKARHMERGPVVAAMFGSWLKSCSAATTFWCAVRDETGGSPTLPDRKLARFLMMAGVATGRGTARVRSAEPREMYVKCIHAWNAWRKDETTDLRYYADKDIPSFR